MKCRVVASVTVSVVAVLLMSPPAMAKGPSQGVITGPGLVEPIELREPGAKTIGVDLASVAMESGFFEGVWGGDPDRLTRPPAGDLGPRYTITYSMTVSRRLSGTITQFVYPYAEPLSVTHIPAKQRFWGSNETVGGWFVAGIRFRRTLISLGLPAARPSPTVGIDAAATAVGSQADSISSWLLVAMAIPALALMVILLRRRLRRPGLLHRA
jgi:hypothetical protein